MRSKILCFGLLAFSSSDFFRASCLSLPEPPKSKRYPTLLLVLIFLISLMTPWRFGREVFSFSWTCCPSFSSLLKSWNSLSRSLSTKSFSVRPCTLNGFFWLCCRSTYLYLVKPKVGSIVGLLATRLPVFNVPYPWPADLVGLSCWIVSAPVEAFLAPPPLPWYLAFWAPGCCLNLLLFYKESMPFPVGGRPTALWLGGW